MPRSKSSTVTKVGTKVKPKNKNGRKLCDRGTKCPYQHEYQHGLEYYHEELVAERFPGKVRKLGGAGSKARTKTTASLSSSSSSLSGFHHSNGRILGTATVAAAVDSSREQTKNKGSKETITATHHAIIGTRNNPIEIKDSQDN